MVCCLKYIFVYFMWVTTAWADFLPYIQLLDEPTPDIIPYTSIVYANKFIKKHELNILENGAFYGAYADALKDLVVYKLPRKELEQTAMECSASSVKGKKLLQVIKSCAIIAAIDTYVNAQFNEIVPEQFGYIKKNTTLELKNTAEGYSYFLGPDNENYLVQDATKQGIILECRNLYLVGYLSAFGDYSTRDAVGLRLNREFVVYESKCAD